MIPEMIFNDNMEVNVQGIDTAFEGNNAHIPTFIYHDHDRVQGHGNGTIVNHHTLKEDDGLPMKFEVPIHAIQELDPECIYEFTNNKNKPLVAEDAEKRRVRRERNKLAASKCRKKRKDHVRNLVESYEQLEACNKNLQIDIEKLNEEIRELEKMLDTHPCTRLLYTETGTSNLA